MVCEDPQRRLDARAVNTLAHQVSLVRHVIEDPRLRRVLIADEVGLGKTVEAGLIISELLEGNPGLRVLYLAPARLVRNVRIEFERLNLNFRQWTAVDRDAVLRDPRIIASIHKAVHGANFGAVLESGPWDVLVVDECHHLSDWALGGGDPKVNYRLVRDLIAGQKEDGRVLFLSGTPHQGHIARFENLVRLLQGPTESPNAIGGRVIYRTKDDVRDWNGDPLFPKRQVNNPILYEPSNQYRAWIQHIYDFYHPSVGASRGEAQRRASGWRCAQALQWAASSPKAGIGYLVRQAIRAGWRLDSRVLVEALLSLRPYRAGSPGENVQALYDRIQKEIGFQADSDEIEDIEELEGVDDSSSAGTSELGALLSEGLLVLRTDADGKWNMLKSHVLDNVGTEKVVLFAQPIETVMALANYLTSTYGRCPAIIIGGQSDQERQAQIEAFWRIDGPQFLVSSRAGGEGINLQIARRLVHIDVPWNPMELEQRVGRIHRFGSRSTIIVDTIVAQGSREEEAYRVARQKLALAVGTLVEPSRFEATFSRVMSLVSQDDIQALMLGSASAPMGPEDQETLAALVRKGFNVWKEFHGRFARDRERLESLVPGAADWSDFLEFLREFCDARLVEGFHAQRFTEHAGKIDSVLEPAQVITFDGKGFYSCGDYSGAPVFGPRQERADAIGLNIAQVTQTLRRLAFPSEVVGAAHLRWPEGWTIPVVGRFPFGIIIFARQTLRPEQGTWAEVSSSLHCYTLPHDGTPVQLRGAAVADVLRGVFYSTVRVKPDEDAEMPVRVWRAESVLLNGLRMPTADEAEARVRHAVLPIFAGIFGRGV